jgi:hypothetical protein
MERVKGIEPSYSAWKSSNFHNVFNSRSDISQPFGQLRSLWNFALSEWRLRETHASFSSPATMGTSTEAQVSKHVSGGWIYRHGHRNRRRDVLFAFGSAADKIRRFYFAVPLLLPAAAGRRGPARPSTMSENRSPCTNTWL